MIKYVVWCRWTPLAGEVPNPRDKEWNIIPDEPNQQPCQWGFLNEQQAAARAARFVQNWQPGMMETLITPVELPD